MAIKKVIDLSKWNAVADYAKVAKAVDGVIIRCGYRGLSTGIINKDPLFETHMNGLLKNNIPMGVYFFTTAISEAEAVEEADYVINLVKSNNISLAFPIAVDTEFSNANHTGRSDSLSKTARTTIVKAFLDRVKSKGYDVMIYCSNSWCTYNIDYDTVRSYKKWIARYGGSKPSINENLVGWQYGTTTIDGINSPVDTNEWYGDIIVPVPAEVVITAGMKLTLDKVNLYASSTTTKVAAKKTGTFYIWSTAKRNNRIRITNNIANVGKSGQITGWISIDDVK